MTTLDEYPGRGKLKTALEPLAALWERIGPSNTGMRERIDSAWDFYRPYLLSKFDDYPKREADIKEFIRLSREYSNLNAFLADMTLEPPNTSMPTAAAVHDQNPLVLSTVHSAKGLEWKAVFIIGVTEGRFPPSQAGDNPESLDEERRLMYVAATRAKDFLFLVCPLEGDAFASSAFRPPPVPFHCRGSHRIVGRE